MIQKRILLLASMAMLMFGCKAQTASNEQPAPVPAPVAVETPAVEKLSAQQLLEPKLKKDMPYAELRKIVLADGWLPLVTPECKENIGGEANICAQQPEVEACSADGYCNMYFIFGDGSTKLRVGTYDDSARFWEFSSEKNNGNVVACPAEKFEDFLRIFASDQSVRDAFTMRLVKVEQLMDNEENGYGMQSVYFKKSDYKDFNLVYQKDGFHAVFNEDIGPKSIPVEIKQENASSYFVRFVYGMSEGNSYRFQKNSGCWYLAEDPEAPSP